MEQVRIDKWLWAVRVYKTRTLAAEACRAGHVEISGQNVKASREVRINDIISARVGIILRTVKVIGLLERRVGPKLVDQYAEDLTPQSEYDKLKEQGPRPVIYPKGFGRPTKKDRRVLDQFLSDS
jgi:ribosome-associated heat shock protein Hsp15